MSNYLKKSIFCLIILMMPYMNSASKAMNIIEDYEGFTVPIRKVSLMSDDQKDTPSSVKQSMSSQIESLEDSKISWMSYLLSPAKVALQGAYDVVNFTTQNPNKAMIIGVYLAYQVTAVAAQNCMGCTECWCDCGNTGGAAFGVLHCVKLCIIQKLPYYGCNPMK